MYFDSTILIQIHKIHLQKKVKHPSNINYFVTRGCASRIFQTIYDNNNLGSNSLWLELPFLSQL